MSATVKLISSTKPEDPNLDSQDLVAYVARVSNPKNQHNHETAAGLLRYLIKHNHWSPLELVHITLEIETTRDIARQILRHRSFTFQEFSQRYADPKELGYPFVVREARLQDTKNRQNSIESDDRVLEERWVAMQKDCILSAERAYDWAIENGIAKEQARAVLPEGLTKSRLYMTGSLRSWLHYCQLRTANGTQKEHMEVAEMCLEEVAKVFPILKEIL